MLINVIMLTLKFMKVQINNVNKSIVLLYIEMSNFDILISNIPIATLVKYFISILLYVDPWNKNYYEFYIARQI